MDTSTNDDALVLSAADLDKAEGGTEEGEASDGEEDAGGAGGDGTQGKRRKQPLSVSLF